MVVGGLVKVSVILDTHVLFWWITDDPRLDQRHVEAIEAAPELAGSLDLVHRDPFDRLIAAQSIVLNIPVATVDSALALLGCKTV